jgi:hypothetical protein
LKDFESSSPDLVIDGVHGASFGYNNPLKHSPEIFPELEKIISSEYFHIAPLLKANDCPKLYLKKDLKEALYNRIVIPISVHASNTFGGKDSQYSIYNLFDNSITEDSCADYWLLPNKEIGNIEIKLSRSEKISALNILNTRNGKNVDRSTEKIFITFRNNDILVNSREYKLQAYPFWTKIEFENPLEIDNVIIEILEFNGLGAGLNEIQILRTD